VPARLTRRLPPRAATGRLGHEVFTDDRRWIRQVGVGEPGPAAAAGGRKRPACDGLVMTFSLTIVDEFVRSVSASLARRLPPRAANGRLAAAGT
jgi:hypothetical protein